MIVGPKHRERSLRPGGEAFVRLGRAPCVVFFHGFTGTTAEIRPALDALARAGFAVHAPLLLGHGSSAVDLQNVTFEALTAAMQHELDAAIAEYKEVVLAGFSLGSLVAMELAARKPAGLRGLVLLGNALTLSPGLAAPLGFIDRRGWKLPDWYLMKLATADIRDPEARKDIISYDRDPLRASLEVYRAGVKVRPRLGEIEVPTLILHGAKDRVCPASNVDLVARALGTSDVRTRIYSRSAHLVAADYDRAEVADSVTSFVARFAREN